MDNTEINRCNLTVGNFLLWDFSYYHTETNIANIINFVLFVKNSNSYIWKSSGYPIITARNSSYRKVMFSQVSVSHSVYG